MTDEELDHYDRQRLIDASIEFLCTLKDIYGATRANQMWNDLDSIDTDLSNRSDNLI